MGGENDPTPENATLFQGFEWNVPADGKHYQRLLTALPGLKDIGISSIWLPPGCKASSPNVLFTPSTTPDPRKRSFHLSDGGSGGRCILYFLLFWVCRKKKGEGGAVWLMQVFDWIGKRLRCLWFIRPRWIRSKGWESYEMGYQRRIVEAHGQRKGDWSWVLLGCGTESQSGCW